MHCRSCWKSMIKNTQKEKTQLDIWIQINQIYNISKPKGLIQSYIIKANISTNVLFIGIIIWPTIIGLLLLDNQYFYLWIIIVLVLYITLLVIINNKVLQDNYSNNDIYNLLVPAFIITCQTELLLATNVFVTSGCYSALQIFQQSCSQSFADKFTKLAIINHKIISILRRRK